MQLGICAVFISFCATALVALLSISQPMAVIVIWLLCSLLSLLPTLRSLVPLSVFGTLAMLLAITTALVTAFQELYGNPTTPPQVSPPPLPPSSPPQPGIADWGSAFAATFYAFEGVGLVLPIRNAHLPSEGADCTPRFEWVLCGTLALVASFMAIVGCVCAAAFPSIDSASVTAYLSSRGLWYKGVNLLVASAVLLTFPLQLTPASSVIESALQIHTLRRRRLCRMLLVATCALLVITLPSLDLLIDIMGSCANTFLAALPCIFHIVLAKGDDHTHRWRLCVELVIDALIILVCLGVTVFGLNSAFLSASNGIS